MQWRCTFFKGQCNRAKYFKFELKMLSISSQSTVVEIILSLCDIPGVILISQFV